MGASASVLSPRAKPADELLQFPKDGIKLRYLKDFIEHCGGRESFDNLTTAEVCKKYVMPDTAKLQVSFCDLLRRMDHPAVGIATVFISHTWKYYFLDVVDALFTFFVGNEDVVIWFDLFSNNQHTASALEIDWWTNTFKTAIGQIGHTVMVFAPWTDPIPLTRAWCLWELYCTEVTKAKFSVAMTKPSTNAFIKEVCEDTEGTLNSIFDTINVIRSDSYKHTDKLQIFDVIINSVGFDKINEIVVDKLRNWAVDAIDEYIMQLSPAELEDDNIIEPIMHAMITACIVANNLSKASATATELVKKLEAKQGTESRNYQLALLRVAEVGIKTTSLKVSEGVLLDVLNKSEFADVKAIASFHMANLYEQHLNFDEALDYQSRALGLFKSHFGTNNKQTLSSMSHEGDLLIKLGNYDKATPVMEECLALHKEVFGESHPSTINVISNMSLLYEGLGKGDKAEVLLVSTFNTTKVYFGASHRCSRLLVERLIDLYNKQQKYRTAERYLITILEEFSKDKGPYYEQAMVSYKLKLTEIYTHTSQLEEAIKILQALAKSHEENAVTKRNSAHEEWLKMFRDKIETLQIALNNKLLKVGSMKQSNRDIAREEMDDKSSEAEEYASGDRVTPDFLACLMESLSTRNRAIIESKPEAMAELIGMKKDHPEVVKIMHLVESLKTKSAIEDMLKVFPNPTTGKSLLKQLENITHDMMCEHPQIMTRLFVKCKLIEQLKLSDCKELDAMLNDQTLVDKMLIGDFESVDPDTMDALFSLTLDH